MLKSIAARRGFATLGLKERVKELIPKKIDQIKAIRSQYGDKVLGTCTINQAYTGMRSVKAMVTETSELDVMEGIRFRGYTIPECQELLPAAVEGGEPIPEGILWLLLTGDIPTKEQTSQLTAELTARSAVPDNVMNMIKSFPKDLHPMSQFSAAVLALQRDSKFAAAYASGAHKSTFWEYYYEDMLDLVAKLPTVSSAIYRNTFHNGDIVAPDNSLDWGGNFAHQLGGDTFGADPKFRELIRLYMSIHSDHEGGNVSAHTTHLVGSALSDCYQSFSAGLNGLAGPLHGLANQEVLKWIRQFADKLGDGWEDATEDQIKEALWDTLNSGNVVPGYGHAVLRKTDPRFTCQNEFALKHMPADPWVGLVTKIYNVAPGVLTEHGKAKNPWPNVDSHSGVLLVHFGMTEESFYTVMFGASRALGVLPSLVWDRALGMAIERPKSLTTDTIEKMAPSL